MAQFTIKWPNGAEVTYEGDVSFSDLEKFLAQETPPPLLNVPASPARSQTNSDAAANLQADRAMSLDPALVEAQFAQVGAKSDIERATILAYLAQEAGLPGIDIPASEKVYRELGLPMPGAWRSTFSNAQTRGYLINAGRGVYRPTSAGLNFARLGQRKQSVAKGKRRRRDGAELPSNGGDGEPD